MRFCLTFQASRYSQTFPSLTSVLSIGQKKRFSASLRVVPDVHGPEFSSLTTRVRKPHLEMPTDPTKALSNVRVWASESLRKRPSISLHSPFYLLISSLLQDLKAVITFAYLTSSPCLKLPREWHGKVIASVVTFLGAHLNPHEIWVAGKREEKSRVIWVSWGRFAKQSPGERKLRILQESL